MQKDIFKKKLYLRPEAEAVWMEEEGMIALSGEGSDQDPSKSHEGWGSTPGVKRNVIRTDQWDDWEDEEEDDGWVY